MNVTDNYKHMKYRSNIVTLEFYGGRFVMRKWHSVIDFHSVSHSRTHAHTDQWHSQGGVSSASIPFQMWHVSFYLSDKSRIPFLSSGLGRT